MKNTPYTKVIDPIQGLLNPISGAYTNPFPNRKARRVFKNRERFAGNGKTSNLTVMKTGKFKRVLQFAPVRDKDGMLTGKFNRIEHYLPS
jgi:hypothetical protein